MSLLHESQIDGDSYAILQNYALIDQILTGNSVRDECIQGCQWTNVIDRFIRRALGSGVIEREDRYAPRGSSAKDGPAIRHRKVVLKLTSK